MRDDNERCNSRRPGADPFSREAKRAAWRAAWRARRAARHAGRGDWSHFGDPKFWGLDPDSMKQWGFGQQQAPPNEVEALRSTVAGMEKTIDAMLQRIAVLEKIVVDEDTRVSREIDKLRGAEKGHTP